VRSRFDANCNSNQLCGPVGAALTPVGANYYCWVSCDTRPQVLCLPQRVPPHNSSGASVGGGRRTTTRTATMEPTEQTSRMSRSLAGAKAQNRGSYAQHAIHTSSQARSPGSQVGKWLERGGGQTDANRRPSLVTALGQPRAAVHKRLSTTSHRPDGRRP